MSGIFIEIAKGRGSSFLYKLFGSMKAGKRGLYEDGADFLRGGIKEARWVMKKVK